MSPPSAERECPRQALQAAMSCFSALQKGAKDEMEMNDGGFG
jgi:hypothetical protein